MELAIELEIVVIDHFTTVGFEAVVDVVQVQTGQFAHQAIEDARREGFVEGIQAREFPASHYVIAFIKFREEIGNLLRIILQISIHGKYHITPAAAKTRNKRGRLAKVFTKAHDVYSVGMFSVQFLQFSICLIRASIINKNHLKPLPQLVELCRELFIEQAYA